MPGLGPKLRTLRQNEFKDACADLMHLAEAAFRPDAVVGIRTGGLVVAEAMVQAASMPIPVLPITSRRATTGVKARVPLLRSTLAALPQPAVDLLRRVEHRVFTAPRAQRPRPQTVDAAEVGTIAAWANAANRPPRILVADDAVDSGVTLATVLRHLREACPPGCLFRTAAITQTLENPTVMPDYVLLHATLCRFPWSFDAAD